MSKTAYKPINRDPVGAGRFYPAYKESLIIEIEKHIKEAGRLSSIPTFLSHELLALIAPHAGYVFSGTVAAAAFSLLEKIPPRSRVFLIGSSHHTDFNGASIYNKGHYSTPLGEVKVDLTLANKLTNESETINFVSAAHAHEHSLEVMLPFLQYFWKDKFEIIPIIIATQQKETCKKLAKTLQPYLNSENLFIVSTDLSHYPNYSDAQKIDKKTVEAILSGKAKNLFNQIKENASQQIPNLSTSICGWSSVSTLLYMAEKLGNIQLFPLLYQNSGDSKPYCDNDRVVGYQSIALSSSTAGHFELTVFEKETLIQAAKNAILSHRKKLPETEVKKEDLTNNLIRPAGAFVSIYVNNELRGCIGRMQSTVEPLIEIVKESAISSAFHDSRFASLSNYELDTIEVEISVLSPMKKITDLNNIVLGKHGIYIKKGFHSGTFLPQVAEKMQWTVEEFVGNCSKNKARLGWDGWKDADLFIYEAIVFRG